MKKSELNFKCVVPNSNVSDLIIRRLGIKTTYKTTNNFIQCDKGSYATSSCPDYFCLWPQPLMSHEEAINLIERVDQDAPEFDIKPFDKVLIRMNESSIWNCDFHNVLDYKGFWVIGGFGDEAASMMIKYEGNENFHGTNNTPVGWWEVNNSKPIWVSK